MRIAVDAMGGDHGSHVNVQAALAAARDYGHHIILVGHQHELERQLPHPSRRPLIEVHHAPEVVEMHEKPAEACRQKPHSSIMVAARLVAEHKAEAVVSAGNSGATMAAALLHIGRTPGASRPAIATPMPTISGTCVVLDMGANVDCKPKHLVQFAIMGEIYAREIFKIRKPRVGLISIGEEHTKGNELTLAAYELLKDQPFHFIGNVEGKDIPKGRVDVAVCDGFVGNVILKFGEGLAESLLKLIKEEIRKKPEALVGALLLKRVFKSIKKRTDYEEYGGAPLLGVNKAVIISHGSSNAKAIQNAIRVAGEFVKKKVTKEIEDALKVKTWQGILE